MDEDIRRLVEAFTDPAMTGEGRASILAYTRSRLEAQRELQRRESDVPGGEPEKPGNAGGNYSNQTAGEYPGA